MCLQVLCFLRLHDVLVAFPFHLWTCFVHCLCTWAHRTWRIHMNKTFCIDVQSQTFRKARLVITTSAWMLLMHLTHLDSNHCGRVCVMNMWGQLPAPPVPLTSSFYAGRIPNGTTSAIDCWYDRKRNHAHKHRGTENISHTEKLK